MSENLESILTSMEPFGKPRLGKYDGWHCGIDMTVNAVGAEFKINSTFGHETPLSAAVECRQRMDDVLRGLASNAKRIGSGES